MRSPEHLGWHDHIGPLVCRQVVGEPQHPAAGRLIQLPVGRGRSGDVGLEPDVVEVALHLVDQPGHHLAGTDVAGLLHRRDPLFGCDDEPIQLDVGSVPGGRVAVAFGLVGSQGNVPHLQMVGRVVDDVAAVVGDGGPKQTSAVKSGVNATSGSRVENTVAQRASAGLLRQCDRFEHPNDRPAATSSSSTSDR